MRLGVHIAVGQGLTKAINAASQLGCESVQIFSGNPRGWKNPAVDPEVGREFIQEAERLDIRPVVVHATYLINLASPNPEIYEKSCLALSELLDRAAALGAPFVVLHPGSHLGEGQADGVSRIGSALQRLLEDRPAGVRILLENVAGGGSTIGGSLAELANVVEAAGPVGASLGLCLDTCHAWAAGYDLTTDDGWAAVKAEASSLLGDGVIKVIHANDAMGGRGTHLDRHTHIGEGQLGESCFKAMMRVGFEAEVACILETPKDRPDADEHNLGLLRQWRADSGR